MKRKGSKSQRKEQQVTKTQAKAKAKQERKQEPKPLRQKRVTNEGKKTERCCEEGTDEKRSKQQFKITIHKKH